MFLGQGLGITGIQAALLPGNPGAGMVPMLGFFAAPISLMWALQALWVLGPAVASVGVGLRGLGKSIADPASWALLLNGVFVASLPPASTNLPWWSARIGLAVIIALAWVLARAERPRLAYSAALFLLAPSLLFVVLGGDLGALSCGGVDLEQGPPTRWWLPRATPSVPR